MRDVKITGGKRISVIDSSTGGAGLGGLGPVIGGAAILFAGVAIVEAALAIAHIVAMVLLTVFLCAVSLFGAAALTGLTYVAVRLYQGKPIRRSRPARQLPTGIPPYRPPITGHRDKVLVELNRADAERLRRLMSEWRG